MQIFVFGMHRSGTSMITRLINMMGAYFGPEDASIGFNDANPKGFWERRDVMSVNDSLLKHNHCAWDRLAAWQPGAPVPLLPEQKKRLQALILNLDAHRPWVVKDPRLCLTYSYWRPLLEVPVGVVVYRSPLEAARSLERRNRIPVDYGLAMWEYHAVSLLGSIADTPCLFVDYTRALADPVRFVHEMKDALEANGVRGLRLPSDREILAFVDPALMRARSTPLEVELLSSHRQRIDAMMRGEALQAEPVELSQESVERMQAGY